MKVTKPAAIRMLTIMLMMRRSPRAAEAMDAASAPKRRPKRPDRALSRDASEGVNPGLWWIRENGKGHRNIFVERERLRGLATPNRAGVCGRPPNKSAAAC